MDGPLFRPLAHNGKATPRRRAMSPDGIGKLTATGKAKVRRRDGRHDPGTTSLSTTPLPWRDHQSRSMAVSLFSLSLRDIELILTERGVAVTLESIRHRCRKFGVEFARRLHRRRPRPGDTWHLGEVFICRNGVQHDLWRAVDQRAVVMDFLVQEKRDGVAAKWFFRR